MTGTEAGLSPLCPPVDVVVGNEVRSVAGQDCRWLLRPDTAFRRPALAPVASGNRAAVCVFQSPVHVHVPRFASLAFWPDLRSLRSLASDGMAGTFGAESLVLTFFAFRGGHALVSRRVVVGLGWL
jgi:hypothetical protein